MDNKVEQMFKALEESGIDEEKKIQVGYLFHFFVKVLQYLFLPDKFRNIDDSFLCSTSVMSLG